MSKPQSHQDETLEPTEGGSSSSHHEHLPSTELQPQEPLADRTTFDDVKSFADSHRLSHRLDILLKAAVILQGETSLESVPGITASEIQALKDQAERKWRQPKMLYFTILVCSIGAMEQGWAQTGMNGANLYFPKALGIGSSSKHDTFLVGLINSGIYLSTGLL